MYLTRLNPSTPKLDFLHICGWDDGNHYYNSSINQSRLALSDIYKNAYTKQSRNILVEVHVLELDVPIEGLSEFPDSFFPETTLVQRRFTIPQPSLVEWIKQDYRCDEFIIPPLE